MKKTAQIASTQAFTEITDIQGNTVLFKDNTACLVIKVTSVNFALLSAQEQDTKVYAYAALLNSLSFPIQIIVRSKPIYIAPYLASIDIAMQQTNNSLLKTYIGKYKEFVSGLVQNTTVLDKQFYIVISYSGLEAGVGSVLKTSKEDFLEQAQTSLQTKADSLLAQISRLSLKATALEKEELTKLFYDLYNSGQSLQSTTQDMENPMVKGAL